MLYFSTRHDATKSFASIVVDAENETEDDHADYANFG
jgi:hypothetical protein